MLNSEDLLMNEDAFGKDSETFASIEFRLITRNTREADLKVCSKVPRTGTYISKAFVRNDEPAVYSTGTEGVEVLQHIDGTANRPVCSTGASARLHAPVFGRRH